MKIIRIIISLLIFQGTVFSQDSGDSYKYIAFENFIGEKVKNDSIFMLEMYEAIGRFPKNARKNEVEAKIEVMIINHSPGYAEFIYSKESCIFYLSEDDIKKVFDDNSHKREERFFTRFFIVYDLEPWRDKESAYHKKYTGLVNNNSFVILGYEMPVSINQY